MRWAGLVAAAGTSSRMGFPKCLLCAPGEAPWSVVVARLFASRGMARVTCTLPPLVDDVGTALRARLASSGAEVMDNRWPSRGLLGSLQTVLAGVADVDALVFTPVDVPGVTASLVDALLATAERTPGRWVRPVCGALTGHPLVVPAALFRRVLALGDGDTMRAALVDAPGVELPWDDPRACASINTPQDAAEHAPPLGRWTP